MPLEKLKNNPNCIVVSTPRGGHFQYFQGKSVKPNLKDEYSRFEKLFGWFLPNDRWTGKATKEYIDFVEEFQSN
jgi:predicted alpha/beta-fold hydrolase